MICYAYMFPCVVEDHCKVGFSRDPLARLVQLHPRWHEVFDLQDGWLVEGETERDARDLELRLRRPLVLHRAPAPLTIRAAAGGHTEWLRGARPALAQAVCMLAREGYRVHAPLAPWLRAQLHARCERLYDWSSARWGSPSACAGDGRPPLLQGMRDILDGFTALGIELAPWLPPEVLAWYRIRPASALCDGPAAHRAPRDGRPA